MQLKISTFSSCPYSPSLFLPTDVDSPEHSPEALRNFVPMPLAKFPVPGLVVASANDPYVTLDRLRAFAGSWDADFCYAGEDR